MPVLKNSLHTSNNLTKSWMTITNLYMIMSEYKFQTVMQIWQRLTLSPLTMENFLYTNEDSQ